MIERKRTLDSVKAARNAGDYDDLPLLMTDVDPQVYLSRNTVPQPFHLICEKDTVLAQLSGTARLELRETNVAWYNLVPGDNVYVPAGTPHRILPETESVQIRYKAREPGREAVAFCCERCRAELFVHTWDTAAAISQGEYADACARFNAGSALRTCTTCGHTADPVDVAPFRWTAVAEALRAERAT